MKYLAPLAAALAAAPALAHEGTAAHLHPHGGEYLLMALLVLGGAAGLARLVRKRVRAAERR